MPVGGCSVTLTVFGDDGWESASETWGERWNNGESLAGIIEKAASVPREEAERIAETLDEWKGRGGADADSGGREAIAYLVTTFGLAALGVIALIALVVWLVSS